jgi:hypothetical protein
VAASILAAAAVLLLFVGCGLSTQGLPGAGGGGSSARTCNVDHDCDDKNPCTTDTCNLDKVCESKDLDGVPSPEQTAGDCKTVHCVKGKASTETDDTDVPDDHESCTTDKCMGGVGSNAKLAEGTDCDKVGAAGTCEDGVCTVHCNAMMPCPPAGTCQTASCNAATGKCVYTPLPDGTPTPGVTQIAGDCLVHICVDGIDTPAADDSDVPKTATDCDTEVCKNGVASNPPKATDTSCSTFLGSAGVCSSAGACVQCTKDVECHGPDPNDNCQARKCTNNACAPFTVAGTDAAAQFQIAGDCQKVVCDGNGGHMLATDANDPASDGNFCTSDTCSGTTTVHAPANATKPCGMTTGATCNATGQCGCGIDADCTAPNTCGGGGTAGVCGCAKKPCAPATCGTVGDGCFGMQNCDNSVKDGSETDVDCGGGGNCATKCVNGKKCGAAADCASGFCVDGVCCNSDCTGLCLACSVANGSAGIDGTCGPIKAGTDPKNECTDAMAPTCKTDGFCDGAGACELYPSGTTCVAASCGGSVLTKADTCNGNGACVDNGTQDCAPFQCKGTACVNPCIMNGDCVAGYFCIGGVCQKKPDGTACGMSAECASGQCVSMICCATACTDMGKASCGQDGKCSAATGQCELYPASTTCHTAVCSGGMITPPRTCDGMGTCMPATAAMSCGGFDCSNGTACRTSCMMDVDCITGDYCDAMSCFPKKASGAPCTRKEECVSNSCTGSPKLCG